MAKFKWLNDTKHCLTSARLLALPSENNLIYQNTVCVCIAFMSKLHSLPINSRDNRLDRTEVTECHC